MNKSSFYISIVALLLSAAAMAVTLKNCGKKVLTSDVASSEDSAFSANLSNTLNENPEIIINALEKYQQKQIEEQQKMAEKLFSDNVEALNNSVDAPYVGNKDAKVVLVEFFDFSCGYCKHLAPAIEKVVENNSDIKVVFQPLTFLGGISPYAARAALAANAQGKFMPIYTAFLGFEGRLTEEAIKQIAQENGLDMDRFAADIESDSVKTSINNISDLANKLQVHGVPFLVLNGKPLQAFDAESIQSAIDRVK